MKYNKFYDAAPEEAGGYGYQSDEVKQSPFNFGGNFGVTKLKEFKWIPNGGANGAEQEALEIIFDINGTDKSYRKFPVVKAFGDNNEEITDPTHPKFKEALSDFNATITHILHAFVDSDDIKAAFQRPIRSFKEFCQLAESILPKNFNEIPLDIFLQYQWQLRDGQERTYLEIPAKMKYGKWLVPAEQPVGAWKEVRVDNPNETVKKALYYVDEAGNEHTFVKNGWFMASNFARMQKTGGNSSSASASQGAAMNQGTQAPASQPKQASSW